MVLSWCSTLPHDSWVPIESLKHNLSKNLRDIQIYKLLYMSHGVDQQSSVLVPRQLWVATHSQCNSDPTQTSLHLTNSFGEKNTWFVYAAWMHIYNMTVTIWYVNKIIQYPLGVCRSQSNHIQGSEMSYNLMTPLTVGSCPQCCSKLRENSYPDLRAPSLNISIQHALGNPRSYLHEVPP